MVLVLSSDYCKGPHVATGNTCDDADACSWRGDCIRVVKPPLIEVVVETGPNLKRVPVVGVTASQVDTLVRSEPSLESVLGESRVCPSLVLVLVLTVS